MFVLLFEAVSSCRCRCPSTSGRSTTVISVTPYWFNGAAKSSNISGWVGWRSSQRSASRSRCSMAIWNRSRSKMSGRTRTTCLWLRGRLMITRCVICTKRIIAQRFVSSLDNNLHYYRLSQWHPKQASAFHCSNSVQRHVIMNKPKIVLLVANR